MQTKTYAVNHNYLDMLLKVLLSMTLIWVLVSFIFVPNSSANQEFNYNAGGSGAIGETPARAQISRDQMYGGRPIKIWAFFDTDSECLCYVTTAQHIDCVPASQLSSNVGNKIAKYLTEYANAHGGQIPKIIYLP